MTSSQFDQQVLIEQLRYIEAQDSLDFEKDDLMAELTRSQNFEARLALRATRLAERNNLKPALYRASKLTRIANGVGLLVAAVLGVLAANLALSGGNTINIYWLLLVLLGFNFISMLLWLVGISFKLDGLMAGGLAKMTSWFSKWIKHNSQAGAAAERAWLACNFGGRVGKWQLSVFTHQLWLVYLLSGLAIALLVLMARQYDFVWGTTLLSESAFVQLTELLSKPLQVLGLTTPTAEQVVQTRIGADGSLTAGHSNSWAQFLLGALVLYGLFPRLLLLLWALLMRSTAKRSFTLDYYLPYYIDLRQQLLPQASRGEIDDADAYPPAKTGEVATSADVSKLVSHNVPADAHWVAVELGSTIAWPPVSVPAQRDLGQIIDRQSLAITLQKLEKSAAGGIAVAVMAERAPDRGVQRIISNLVAAGSASWLVLMHQQGNGDVADMRLGAWYRLAEACGVQADHVVIMAVA